MRNDICMNARLLRHLHAMLSPHLPEWLSSRKAGIQNYFLGCTSSHTILFTRWKEIFSIEDAARFDLVDELYALTGNKPTMFHQFAAWLQEDCKTKVVATDEVSAHIEPR